VCILNKRALTEYKKYDAMKSFYEKLEQVLDHFVNCHIRIMLQGFKAVEEIEEQETCSVKYVV
jgi:hypothetical protein